MQRKEPWLLYAIFGAFFGYMGYLFAGAYIPDCNNILLMYEKLVFNINNPIGNYWNEYSIWGILGFLFFYLLFISFYILSKKNYMFGKEYGTSKFANPATINHELADLDNKREGNIVVKKEKWRKHGKVR